MRYGDDGQNSTMHTFDRDKYLMFLTYQMYKEGGNSATMTGKMERNATKGENQYEPGVQVVLDDVAGFRIASQAMCNFTDKTKEKVFNGQFSAYNDDLWFGTNVKYGSPKLHEKIDKKDKNEPEPTTN